MSNIVKLYFLILLWSFPLGLGVDPVYGQIPQEPIKEEKGRAARSDSKELEGISQSWLNEVRSREDKGAPINAPASPTDEASSEAPQLKKTRQRLRLADPGPLGANDNAPRDTEQGSAREAPSFVSVLLRFSAFIFLLVLIAFLGLRFFRLRSRGPFRRGDELVEVLISVPLVQGKFLQVVDVAGLLLVLGVSDSGVQLLTSVSDGVTADRIRLWQSQKRPEPSPIGLIEKLGTIFKGTDMASGNKQNMRTKSFASTLMQFSGKSGSGQESNDAANLKRLLRRQKQRLSQMQEDV